jgi:hypothetical protein
MANSWTMIKQKLGRQMRTANADALLQAYEDWNTGYHLFNDDLARYYTQEQQFCNLVDGQFIYQTPIDCVRVLSITAQVTPSYEPPLTEVKSEAAWRRLVSIKTINGSYLTDYRVMGSDKVAVYPTPSQSLQTGFRFIYQPQDHDLAFDDVSTNGYGPIAGINQTVTVTNGSPTVTATGSPFTADMAGWWFQLTNVTDNTWYQIASATTSVLTLKSTFAGTSGSTLAFRVGQLSIIPQSYGDAPMHYALGMYFAAEGNDQRAAVHLGDPETSPGLFYQMLERCRAAYSSANESSIITDDSDRTINAWFIPYIQS